MSKPVSMRKKYSTALEEEFPESIKITIGDHETVYRKHMSLRYGENPHQPAAFYSPTEGPLTVGDIKLLKTGKSWAQHDQRRGRQQQHEDRELL